MKIPSTALVATFCIASMAGMGPARGEEPDAKPMLSRAQVLSEREAFLRTQHWDEASGSWVPNAGFEAPASRKTRAEVLAERDQFLRENEWNEGLGWVPLKPPAADPNAKSRAQVQAETAAYLRTHHWDEQSSNWVEDEHR